MKLQGLNTLYRSMKQQNIERYKFTFVFQNVSFDVLYFIDEQPNILAFGIKQHNYYFELPVKNGFEIRPFLEKYHEFCKIMGFQYNPNSPFKPNFFFEQFDMQIPNYVILKNVPSPSQIAVYRNNIEEADKIYFVKWRDNKKAGHQVSPENLEKTRKLLSYEAYRMCKTKNISSCWSPFPSDERSFTLPK